jgi:hypothetical protein
MWGSRILVLNKTDRSNGASSMRKRPRKIRGWKPMLSQIVTGLVPPVADFIQETSHRILLGDILQIIAY